MRCNLIHEQSNVWHCNLNNDSFYLHSRGGGGGGTDLKGDMWMCGPEDPLFMPLLQFARVPFQAKESVHKTPFWENLEILASAASIFAQILAHKPPNLEIFGSQAPKFGNFQFATPTLQKSGLYTPTCPPPGRASTTIGWGHVNELYSQNEIMSIYSKETTWYISKYLNFQALTTITTF